jgi:hypothetical protein
MMRIQLTSWKWKTALALVGAIGVMVVFQNCGGVALDLETKPSEDAFDANAPVQVPEEDPAVLASFFKYPYSNAPELFVETQVKRVAQSDTAAVGDMVVMASVAAASGQVKTIEYTLKIQDSKKVMICPDVVGVLSGGQTTIVGRCTTARWKDTAHIVLNVKVDGRVLTFERGEKD